MAYLIVSVVALQIGITKRLFFNYIIKMEIIETTIWII